MSELRKARIKLWADYLNGLAIGTLITGGAAPVLDFLIHGRLPNGYMVGAVLMSAAGSVGAHAAAQYVLGRMED